VIRLVDVNGDGFIEFPEFVKLMFGYAEGAEWLANAMRTAFMLRQNADEDDEDEEGEAKQKEQKSDGDSDKDSEDDNFVERPIVPTLTRVMRRVFAQKLPDDIAVVVRIISTYGSGLRFNAGTTAWDDDSVAQDLFLDGEYFDGYASYALKNTGEGVLLGGKPSREFVDVMKRRFRSDVGVNSECRVEHRDRQKLDNNMFLVRLEEGQQLRLLGLMGKDRAVHLWRLSDDSHSAISNQDKEPGNRTMTEERVTAPQGALYFSSRMDCSLLLRFTRMMRMPRDNFLIHLQDSAGLPIWMIITLNLEGKRTKQDFRRRLSRRVSKGGFKMQTDLDHDFGTNRRASHAARRASHRGLSLAGMPPGLAHLAGMG